jgi:hypothetical protein
MRFVAGAVMGLFLLSVAAAAPKTIWRTDNPDAISKLNDDLKQALSAATLNNKQRKELRASQQALQGAVDAHNNKTSFNSQAVLKAYKTIERMNKADVFTAQDKKLIDKDLGRLKEQVLVPPRRRTKRGYDPYGFPYPRRRF